MTEIGEGRTGESDLTMDDFKSTIANCDLESTNFDSKLRKI